MSKRQASDAVQSAMRERELTFTALAERLSRPPVWLAAAVLGQDPFPEEEAQALVAMLDLPVEATAALQEIPTRGALDGPVPVDPTVYRLYEILQVYGPALKALIHRVRRAHGPRAMTTDRGGHMTKLPSDDRGPKDPR